MEVRNKSGIKASNLARRVAIAAFLKIKMRGICKKIKLNTYLS